MILGTWEVQGQLRVPKYKKIQNFIMYGVVFPT